jgi:hypothetical protein
MENSQVILTELRAEIRPDLSPIAPQLLPIVYAPRWARCPRCHIEYPYDVIRFPWCPGCCERPT